jgi:hypothetical protein
MWSDDWTIVASGVILTAEDVIWYCISCYQEPVELPIAA